MRVIYGTGVDAIRYREWLMNMGISIDCFCRSKVKKEEVYDGLPVISKEHLRCSDLIFMSLRNKASTHLIIQELLGLGLDKANIINFSDLYKENSIIRKSQIGGAKYCSICENNVKSFEPTGVDSPLFQKHYIIGGGIRNNAICPVCGAKDRERWLKQVIETKTDILSEKKRVLHIAPERFVEPIIRRNTLCDYYTGDIIPRRADHVVDVTNIQFEDSFFDYVILNHVMEHIKDEALALNEIKRVLKRDGKLILSFPICMDMDTFEDDSISKPEECLRYYGQEDHVRLYGRDYKEHIENYGFDVKVYSPKDIYDHELSRKYGLIYDDVIMICNIE